jgi:hypothetical protein
MMKLETEQEILMHIADMAIITFHAESALLRLMKRSGSQGAEAVKFETDIVHSFYGDSADKIEKHGKDAVNAFAEGMNSACCCWG